MGSTLWLAAVLSLMASGRGHTLPPGEVAEVTTYSSATLPTHSSGINPSTDGNISTPEISTSSPDKADCVCVAYYLCNDEEISGGEEGLIDIHLPFENRCNSYLDVCCKSVNPVPVLNSTTSSPQSSPSSCGHRNTPYFDINVEGYDSEAHYGEFPWMMALLQHDADGKEVYLCGGSLIHPRVVLTGAHCVFGKKNLLIRAGEWDTQTDKEIYPTQDRNVSEVIVHEQFIQQSLFNDMALLILESPVEIKKDEGHIGLICLPEENEDFNGRDCVASGWGKDTFGSEGKYSVILKKVDLPIVARGACEEALRKTRLGSHFKLHSSFICAGGIPGKDTCKGDGGSPLVCPSKSDPDVYVQAGIVAWGIGCSTETPATYVNVPAFVPWVNSQLQKHGISFTS